MAEAAGEGERKPAVQYVDMSTSIWEHGELKTEEGWGRIVKRELFGYAYRDHAVRERERDPRKHKVERQPYDGPVNDVLKRVLQGMRWAMI